MSSYEWGDLKADPRQLVERYFDAFLDAGGRRGRRLERCRPYGKLRTQFNARRLATTRTGGDRAAEHWMREDGAVVTSDLARLDREIRLAASGSVQEYAQVLERAVAACAVDPAAAEFLDELELHSEVADTYDGLGRVEDALRHADVLADRGCACTPDPRCRRAEILTRNGRLAEAAVVWDEVARHTPEDVWVFNNAGLEFGAVGEHELALSWLVRALELAVRTGDPERLVGQLRDLRATSLTALGREHDELQTAPPRTAMACRCRFAWAWLAAEDYAELAERWPDLADSAVVQDENGRLVAHPEYCRRMEQRLRTRARWV